MINIKIVSAPPGPSTTQRVLELVQAHPQGITIKDLKHALNRPVSMLQHCLKPLILEGAISVRLSENQMQQIYYPILHEEEAETA